jgi:S-adenosylmethionine-dependent methyltransferase
VFHDYILDKALREQAPDKVLEQELRLSQLEPYRSLGRYMHVLLKKRMT